MTRAPGTSRASFVARTARLGGTPVDSRPPRVGAPSIGSPASAGPATAAGRSLVRSATSTSTSTSRAGSHAVRRSRARAAASLPTVTRPPGSGTSTGQTAPSLHRSSAGSGRLAGTAAPSSGSPTLSAASRATATP